MMVMIEIIGDDVLEFGIGAGANIAGDIMTVFVHDKENVGAVEISPEAFVGTKETFGISAVIRSEWLARIETRDWAVFSDIFVGVGVVFENWSGPVDDFVTAAFEIPSPVDGTFIKFGATADNEFFHNCK